MESMLQSFQHTMKMLVFNQLKTNDPFIDAILTTLVFTAMAKIVHYFNTQFDCNYRKIQDTCLYYLYTSNKITISGKNCTVPSSYGEFYVSSVYSDRFNAVLQYIIHNTNNSIHEMKELFSNMSNNNSQNNDSYVVCQYQRFTIDKDIYFRIDYDVDTHEGSGSNKPNTKVEHITIEIYSYVYDIHYLADYIDAITNNYRKKMYDDRKNKQFIYTATKCEIKEDSESKYDIWDEQVFTSNRTFDNLFLENKADILAKVDFFLHNKNWYDTKGIPYNLGIGLHGKPGTGKTSFIKALANKTKRDIVILPLKLIRTKGDLTRLFYEATYSNKNKADSKTFDKKIIVFEDIDCIGDIVKKRDPSMVTTTTTTTANNTNTMGDKWILASDNQVHNPSTVGISGGSNGMVYKEPVTLDDFLNIWDGIRETPGRIIIITSNHYDQLDPALTRPGRIDLTYEFKNVNHDVLQEMHQCFFGHKIPESTVEKIVPYTLSPAEVVNLYFTYRDNETAYLANLVGFLGIK